MDKSRTARVTSLTNHEITGLVTRLHHHDRAIAPSLTLPLILLDYIAHLFSTISLVFHHRRTLPFIEG